MVVMGTILRAVIVMIRIITVSYMNTTPIRPITYIDTSFSIARF